MTRRSCISGKREAGEREDEGERVATKSQHAEQREREEGTKGRTGELKGKKRGETKEEHEEGQGRKRGKLKENTGKTKGEHEGN